MTTKATTTVTTTDPAPTAVLETTAPPLWLDTLERAGWTFAQTFFAVEAAAGGGWLNAGVAKAAAVSGGAAVISLLKNLAVKLTPR